MPLVTVQELIDAGVHYGHQASRWNPKMKPFIYGKRHRIHIINLQETIRGLLSATHFLRSLAATGAQIMFLGTKRQIRSVVESESKRCGMPAITERWIGGTLTNFSTVREQLTRLEELEAMEADGTMERHKKKAQSTLRREMRKISRNLEGVRDLHGLPGALVVIDPRREEIAIREAARMNVPVVCILDTDCDPSNADIVIPGNDDAMSSVALLMGRLADAVSEGRAALDPQTQSEAERSAREDIRCKPVVGRQQTQRGGASGRRDGSGGQGGGGRGGRGGRSGPGGGGGRLARGGASGRYAQASGHASSVSVGGESEGGEGKAPAKAEGEAPKADAGTPETKAPEAATPAAASPEAATPAAPAPAPEAKGDGDKPAE